MIESHNFSNDLRSQGQRSAPSESRQVNEPSAQRIGATFGNYLKWLIKRIAQVAREIGALRPSVVVA
jgi:hypothetical protein